MKESASKRILISLFLPAGHAFNPSVFKSHLVTIPSTVQYCTVQRTSTLAFHEEEKLQPFHGHPTTPPLEAARSKGDTVDVCL